MKELSIRLKVLLVVLVPLLVTILLLSFMFIRDHVTDVELAFNTKGKTLCAALASAMEYPAISGNREQFDAISQKLMSDKEIHSIRLYSDNEQISFTTARDDSTTDPANVKTFTLPVYESAIQIQDFNLQNTSDLKQPLAWVSVSLSHEQVRQRRLEIIRNDVLLTSLAIILASFFAIYLASTVSNPLMRLTGAVSRIRDGDLDIHIPTDSGGEMSVLEQSINDMTTALRLAREESRRYAEDALHLEQIKAKTTLEAITEGVITTDANGHITYLNPAAEELLETSRTEAEGQALDQIYKIKSHDTRRPVRFPVEECLARGATIHHETVILTKSDQSEHLIRDTATPIFDRSRKISGMVLVFHDFSKVKILSEQLIYQATHDELTGLLNRRAFESHLENLLDAQVEESSARHAVCYIDLDQFKTVNDTCGHVAGDELLKLVSQEIRTLIRAHDVLARLGGDEFGIVLQDCPKEKAVEIATQICESIKQIDFAWQEHRFRIGASIGLVSFGGNRHNLSDILITADTACYAAKDQGRGRLCVLEPNDSVVLHKAGEMRWLHTLNECIKQDCFELYCQQIRPLGENTNTTSHYEILIRLQDPKTRELISPYSFIETAERYHLMPAIDRWVIRNSLETLSRCPALYAAAPRARPGPCFHINLSGQSFCDADILELLQRELGAVPQLAEKIVFEITETAAIANFNSAQSFINTLHGLGCKFALDDFGKGLSSFAYLKDLDVEYLKIDGHFIRDISSNEVSQSIVESINHISHVMNIQTIAEFVETEDILQFLERYQIDYAQGFAIHKPIPLTSLPGLQPTQPAQESSPPD
jgi:diguanylate cyclase (GGDEF)-like protein/PAS domain S-box-containing protein